MLPVKDEGLNAPLNLAMEATYINHNFSQQVLKPGEAYKFKRPNPFVQGITKWLFPNLCDYCAIVVVS